MSTAADDLLSVLHDVVGPPPAMLHEPYFAGNEWTYVKDCIDSGWVSSVGTYVDRFEAALGALVGGHAVAVVNGTAALHICLLLAGVQPGDEVIAPTLTFVATANSIVYCGAIPHFADSSPETLGIDPERLDNHLRSVASFAHGICINRNTGRPIRAILPMHTFGHPVDMNALAAVAERWGLEMVEDAAEALGSTYCGRPAGSLCRLAAMSFNGNKIATTGGGGAVITSDVTLAHRAKHLTTTAKQPHRWAFAHNEVGWNYRMPNLNAALGLAQLEQLQNFVTAKRRLAERYRAALAGISGLRFVVEPRLSRSNYWLNAVLINDVSRRDDVLAATNDAGYMTRPAWQPMHRLPMYRDCPRAALPVAEDIECRLINLPSSVKLEDMRP